MIGADSLSAEGLAARTMTARTASNEGCYDVANQGGLATGDGVTIGSAPEVVRDIHESRVAIGQLERTVVAQHLVTSLIIVVRDPVPRPVPAALVAERAGCRS